MTHAELAQRLNREIADQATVYCVTIQCDDFSKIAGKRLQTKKELVTVEKCKSIVKNIEEHHGVTVTTMTVWMDEWDYTNITPEDYAYVLSGDTDIPMNINKKAVYNVKKNCLVIWQDGVPIYENNNGDITRDADVLADWYC